MWLNINKQIFETTDYKRQEVRKLFDGLNEGLITPGECMMMIRIIAPHKPSLELYA